jgi:hypothetical protein
MISAAQQGVQWTGGYAPRFQAFCAALGFFRFDGESRPTHLPLTRAVGWLVISVELDYGDFTYVAST